MEEENKTADPEIQTDAAPQAAQSVPQGNLGKFKSVDALMRAYKELEAEFTRRSQKLKALEESAPLSGKAEPSGAAHVSEEAEPIAEEARVPLMTDGGAGVIAPARKPKNIREAGNMALGYLRNQKF